jgi:hypothetical protein
MRFDIDVAWAMGGDCNIIDPLMLIRRLATPIKQDPAIPFVPRSKSQSRSPSDPPDIAVSLYFLARGASGSATRI